MRPWAGWLGLVLLYTLAHGLILVDRGVYWDDWTIWNMSPAVVVANHITAGSYFFGHLHGALASQPQAIALYNWLTFGCYLLSGLLVWRILRRTTLLTEAESWALTALFLVLPLNLARNAMINGQYAICHVVFWAAFALFQVNRHRARPNPVLTAVVALLFFSSFLTNSLLVFFGLVPFYAIWWQARQAGDWRVALNPVVLARAATWMVLPVVYWVLRAKLFPTSGLYASTHYNEVSAVNLLALPRELFRTLYFSLVKVLVTAPAALRSGLVAGLSLGVGGLLLWLTRASWTTAPLQQPVRARTWWGLVAGAVVFFVGAFPYLAVGLLPTQVEWSSRHQLLLPLGTALLLLFGLQALGTVLPGRVARWLQPGLLTVLLLLAVAVDVAAYLAYERDWLKQTSLMRQLRTMPAVRRYTSFLVDDRTRFTHNVFERDMRFYEFAGELKLVYGGDDSRFAITLPAWEAMHDPEHPSVPALRVLAGRTASNLGHFRGASPQALLLVEPGAPLRDTEVLRRTITGDVTDAPATPVVRLRVRPLAGNEGSGTGNQKPGARSQPQVISNNQKRSASNL